MQITSDNKSDAYIILLYNHIFTVNAEKFF